MNLPDDLVYSPTLGILRVFYSPISHNSNNSSFCGSKGQVSNLCDQTPGGQQRGPTQVHPQVSRFWDHFDINQQERLW